MQNAHLALIDALMAVGAMETVSAVKTQGPSELLGGDRSWQDALLHWVNAVRRDVYMFLSCPVTNDSWFRSSVFSMRFLGCCVCDIPQ